MKFKKLLEEIKYIGDSNHVDYGTGDIKEPTDIFFPRTGVSDYDSLIENPDFMEKYKNLKGEIIMMTPYDYFKECSENIFSSHPSIDSLIRQREYDKEQLQDIEDIVIKYKHRLFMPYLNYASNNQEGLHRMLFAAKLFGWTEEKFPVLVVTWADKERQRQAEIKQHQSEYNNALNNCVAEALKYQYPINKVVEYLQIQIQDEIEHSYKFPDDIDKESLIDSVDVSIKDNELAISIDNNIFKKKLSDMRIGEPDDLDDIDLEDLDDDLDDLTSEELSQLIAKNFL